ncbi:MAG TPA: peptidylprolyl isomerase [Verrucomicrobiota bacterium]|nr:peptidylprolyl isomerase [Verrucomicrobiota bacterium]HNT16011.1 peptidylprolyl isomerase [Verrucomicrobiota bacterium]
MPCRKIGLGILTLTTLLAPAPAAPVLDPVPDVTVPAGKSRTLPVTATSLSGRPLRYTVTSSHPQISVEVHTNNPFWKLSVAQAAPAGAPGAYATPFRGGTVTVTNVGDLTFQLLRDRAPRAVEVFQGLTLSGFFDATTIFHRVIPGFMMQGGDPATNGMGGPVFRYDDEFHARAIFSGNGQLALANSGKDTCGSQFFITEGAQRFLDFKHTLFGQLLRGFPVLTNVVNTPRNASDRPLADVIITRASFVTNYTDTVITLTGPNAAGVSSTIQVVADDDTPGGRVTNHFTATTVSDAANVTPPFLNPPPNLNLLCPVNGKLTNFFSVTDLEGQPYSWFPLPYDGSATNTTFAIVGDQLQMILAPNQNFSGVVDYQLVVSRSPDWLTYYQFFPAHLWPPYDWQHFRFVVGDTAIHATPATFVAQPQQEFSDQLLATFTNGIPDSLPGSFSAVINWGDNTLTTNAVVAGGGGLKEVRGSHTYLRSGHYPIRIRIQSVQGATTEVLSRAHVPPRLRLAWPDTAPVLCWPAWATDYRLQICTNLEAGVWANLPEFPTLNGYEMWLTNGTAQPATFYRLRR